MDFKCEINDLNRFHDAIQEAIKERMGEYYSRRMKMIESVMYKNSDPICALQAVLKLHFLRIKSGGKTMTRKCAKCGKCCHNEICWKCWVAAIQERDEIVF